MHTNIVGTEKTLGPVCISIQKLVMKDPDNLSDLDNALKGTSLATESGSYRVLFRERTVEYSLMFNRLAFNMFLFLHCLSPFFIKLGRQADRYTSVLSEIEEKRTICSVGGFADGIEEDDVALLDPWFVCSQRPALP